MFLIEIYTKVKIEWSFREQTISWLQKIANSTVHTSRTFNNTKMLKTSSYKDSQVYALALDGCRILQ